MKKKPLFVCPSCEFEGVKQFVVSEDQYYHYDEPFTVRKKTRVCEKCEHHFVPEAEVSRRKKLLKLMVVSLFLSKCDKSRKELTKINKKLQKIAKGLQYDETSLRATYIDFSQIDKEEIEREVIKANKKLKDNEVALKQEVDKKVAEKVKFAQENPAKHHENMLKQSRKDKSFIIDNANYLLELVFALTNELGDRSEIEIVNDEGKTEKITMAKLEMFQNEIIENQYNLKQYQAIYDKELIEVQDMLRDEEDDEDVTLFA